ncbi:MAG: hypothetical protein IT319_00545 [Anaerolineae bacterium]|nr:hypothetical protein [Anaerolineae bacterium]
MTLKNQNRVQVRISFAHVGDKLVMDKFTEQLYALISDSFPDAKSDIDIEIEDDDYDLVQNFRESWADAMEGRTISREEFRRRMSDNA